ASYVVFTSLLVVIALLVIRIHQSEDPIEEEVDRSLLQLSAQEQRLREYETNLEAVRKDLGIANDADSLDILADMVEHSTDMSSILKVKAIRALTDYKEKRDELGVIALEIAQLEVRTRKLSLSPLRAVVGVMSMLCVLGIGIALVVIDLIN